MESCEGMNNTSAKLASHHFFFSKWSDSYEENQLGDNAYNPEESCL